MEEETTNNVEIPAQDLHESEQSSESPETNEIELRLASLAEKIDQIYTDALINLNYIKKPKIA